MRVSVAGDPSVIRALQSEMARDPDITVERVEDGKDATALEFGLAEVLVVVGIVKGVAELAKLLLELRSHLASTQKLRVQTATGTAVIELSKETTREELDERLRAVLDQV